jgi:hypothetical protein
MPIEQPKDILLRLGNIRATRQGLIYGQYWHFWHFSIEYVS